MKSVYFVQVGFDFNNSVYLPLAAGTLIAAAKADPDLSEKYHFKDIIYRREKTDAVLQKLCNPYAVAFSCSVWNMQYHLILAKRLKALYPQCLILFGGHSVNEDASLLKEADFIDILLFGEGERGFPALLHGLLKHELTDVPGIAYRLGQKVIINPKQAICDLSVYPSPYLTGVFDDILQNEKSENLLAVLETNRGCPYSCAYCDWTSGHKMRQFPMERVLAEIKWFSEKRIEYIFCADSNFGLFERDLDIAKALVKAKKETGYPKVFRPCYEKNSDERVFEICSVLNTQGMDKGATMAYQTLSEEALQNIGRKNLTMEHFSKLLRRYNEAGIPTYSELILGLPGETLESFCTGICRLLENGQHNSLSVYYCELLPNSRLTEPEYKKRHQIEGIRVPFNHIHSAPKQNEEIEEYSELVRSTATMSRQDWVKANLFSVCVQAFHSLGLLRCFSVYLYYEKQVSYYDFFTALLRYIYTDTVKCKRLFVSFEQKYTDSLKGDWNFHNPAFGNVTWFFEEGLFLEYIADYHKYFEEFIPFLQGYFDNERLFEQLSVYQKQILHMAKPLVVQAFYDWDFSEYFDKAFSGMPTALKKAPITVWVRQKTEYEHFADYAREVLWYGRRRGATVLRYPELQKM